jgi:hypothetical protein
LGQYTKLTKAFRQSLNLNLKTCTIADLEAIHGAGAKTARYFMLHTRPNQRIACLDTHVIRHMRDLGLTDQKGTPGGKKYAELEQVFLNLADQSGMSVADFDLMFDNAFDLDRSFLEFVDSSSNHAITRVGLSRKVTLWLIEHKVEFSFRVLSHQQGIIHIPDRKSAMLFKMRWL